MKYVLAMIAAIGLTTSCSKDEKKGTTGEQASSMATSAATSSAAAPVDPSKITIDMPVQAEFEEEAVNEITKDNVEAKLAELEKTMTTETE